jgi:hypothetical protein
VEAIRRCRVVDQPAAGQVGEIDRTSGTANAEDLESNFRALPECDSELAIAVATRENRLTLLGRFPRGIERYHSYQRPRRGPVTMIENRVKRTHAATNFAAYEALREDPVLGEFQRPQSRPRKPSSPTIII